jgi:hypothetical protein
MYVYVYISDMYVYVYKYQPVCVFFFCFFVFFFAFFSFRPNSAKFGVLLEELRGYVSDPLKPQYFETRKNIGFWLLV